MTEKQRNVTTSLERLLPWLGGGGGGISKAYQLLQKKLMFSCFRNPDQTIIQSCLSGEMVHLEFHLFGSWYDWSLVEKWKKEERNQINISSSADWI